MKYVVLIIICAAFSQLLFAQSITYTTPEKEDVRSVDFEIIGKIKDRYLVYKNIRSKGYISSYDNEMKQVDKVELTTLPDRIITSDIIAYRDFFYLIFQYQKRNIIYCSAMKLNGEGKLMEDAKVLDTTSVNFFASKKIYNVVYSEDKQRIVLYKVNSKEPSNYQLTAVLLDNNINLLSKHTTGIAIQNPTDFLTEFTVDNEGTLVFVKASGNAQSDNIRNLALNVFDADGSYNQYSLEAGSIFFDDIHVKVDNRNRHYLVASFYSKQRHGSIEGLYCILWNKATASVASSNEYTFNNEFRSNAKSEGSSRTAFDNFFLQNITMRRDGGFLIAAESAYSSSRGTYANRWDYYNSSPWYSSNSYLWGNSYGYAYPWSNYGYPYGSTSRYFADNIAIISFDSSAKQEWASVIPKSQFDDNTDNFIGYGTYITAGEINFLFNQYERRTRLLNAQSISPDGKVERKPTLRNLDKGYDFMPRFAKQVSSNEVLVPCQYRSYLCFAKIEF